MNSLEIFIFKKVMFVRQTKSCACLIGAATINLEISKRKNMLRLEDIKKKLKTVENPKKMAKLRAKKKELATALKQTIKHKQHMKKRFHEHIKKSGYVPPIYRGR